MEQALSGLNCHVIPSTSDEAPGLLAYVAPHLGAHHSPDLFHVQHALSKAVSAPMGAKQRAADKAMTTAEEQLTRVQEHAQNDRAQPARRGPGRPPKAAPSLEQAKQEGEAARQEHQRLAGQREQVGQRLRAIGHAYHCVDLERGVRRNGQRIAGAIQHQIDTIRTMAQQEGRSQACLNRIEKAERVVPTMRAPLEFVSAYVRQQVSQLALTPLQAYAVHAHLMPSFSLERVASTRTMTAGEALRARAEGLRTSTV